MATIHVPNGSNVAINIVAVSSTTSSFEGMLVGWGSVGILGCPEGLHDG